MDEVEYTTDVIRDVVPSEDGRLEGKQIQAPPEGVYVHGLYLEGAGWNKTTKHMDDSEPKILHYQFPIIHFSADTTDASQQKKTTQGKQKLDAAQMEK